MNNQPTPQEFLQAKEIDTNDPLLGGNIRIRQIENLLKEYGELCGKYAAKSIRYQAIELILDKAIKADNYQFAEDLTNKIQNLNP